MSKIIFLVMMLPIFSLAQDNDKEDNKQRVESKFRSFSFSLGGGTGIIHSSDINSVFENEGRFRWNTYAGFDYQITHAFGANLYYQMGKTAQHTNLDQKNGYARATTEYQQILF